MFDWLVRDSVARTIQEQLPNLSDFVRKELQQRTFVGVEQDQLIIGGGKVYVLLDTETEQYEIVDIFFDLSKLAGGDSVEVDVYVKFPWETAPRYLHHRAEGPLEDPALRIQQLVCPAGVRLAIRHATGPDREIGYFILRRR